MIWQLIILLAFAPLALSCTGAGSIVLDTSMTELTFQSDNHPAPYPDSNDCEWVFTSPADTQVTLRCSDVDIYGSCGRNKFAYIIEGVEVLFCSGSLDVTSSNNAMTVQFRTRMNRRNSNGFSCVASYTSQGVTTTPQPPTIQPPTTQPLTTQPPVTQPSTCTCGKRNSATSRIVGGVETLPNEFPWQAILYIDGYFACGGSLISNEWVLTAAHCIDSGTAANYIVVLGNHDRSALEAGELGFYVSQLIIHENYESNQILNDVGLMRLSTPVVYSSTISPVCLPFKFESDPTAFDGTTSTVTGWGRLGTSDPTSRFLMEVDLTVLSHPECVSRYPNVPSTQLCAVDNGKGVCFGDSGGPLVYQDNNVDFLTGVVSYVVGGCANPNYFSGFSRVTSYLDWVEQNTGESFEVCN